MFQFRGKNYLFRRNLTGNQMVGAGTIRVLAKTHSAGGIGLRIAVHQQRGNFGGGKGGGQIDGRGGLAYASLLIGYRNCLCHSEFLENRESNVNESAHGSATPDFSTAVEKCSTWNISMRASCYVRVAERSEGGLGFNPDTNRRHNVPRGTFAWNSIGSSRVPTGRG